MLLYQNLTIRQCENRCYEQSELSPWVLMQRAGQAALAVLRNRYSKTATVTVCCGKGNNGGDGLVLARLAHEEGYSVRVLLLEPAFSTETAQQAYEACQGSGVMIETFSDSSVLDADLLVDALLGSGGHGVLRSPCADCVTAINISTAPVMSLDIPTGVDADTGFVATQAVYADSTVTFIAAKAGLVTGKGLDHTGELYVDDLGIPAAITNSMHPCARLQNLADAGSQLIKRKRNVHKGDHGHVLVIGGDYGMGGAVRLSAEAALRAGAGLVTVATRPEHVPIVSGTRPELMCYQVNAGEDLIPLMHKASVIVIGPGLGQTSWAQQLLAQVLASEKPKVLDADALNLIAADKQAHIMNAIMTPHPGEAARLLGCTSLEVQANRYHAARHLADLYRSVVVLKGAGTLVYEVSEDAVVCGAGNPGMASAGMGDVLTGVIAGLLAQGLPLYEATRVGVIVHSTAADKAAEHGGERGLLATDLLECVRELVNDE